MIATRRNCGAVLTNKVTLCVTLQDIAFVVCEEAGLPSESTSSLPLGYALLRVVACHVRPCPLQTSVVVALTGAISMDAELALTSVVQTASVLL